jgi:hypothetical protein
MLKIDVASNIQRGRVVRSGFRKSGVSKHNRLVEWQMTGYGGFWKSYDFASSSGSSDLFAHPTGPAWGQDKTGFIPAGGEIIFNLPNRLHAYMLVNGAGKRIDKAPVEIVADGNNQHDPAIVTGISCMGCHSEGIKPVPDDEVRRHIEAGSKAYTPDEVENVRALHSPPPKMGELVKGANGVYGWAVQVVGGNAKTSDPVSQVNSLYEGAVSLMIAAAELGFTPEQLRGRIGEASPELKRTLAALINENGTVHREAFLTVFPIAVREWSLGEYQAAIALTKKSPPAAVHNEPATAEDEYKETTQAGAVEPLNPVVHWSIVVGILLAPFIPLRWAMRKPGK